jgi:PKD repeat protein
MTHAVLFTGSPGLDPNTSTGTYTDSLWTFSDGKTSTDQNPTYTFTEPGSYTVTLTVTGPGGSDTEIKPRYILAALTRVYLPLALRNH